MMFSLTPFAKIVSSTQMKFLLLFLVALVSFSWAQLNATTSGAQYGVDISTTVSSSSASCFKSNGYSFVVPRGYRSTGAVDTQVCTSIKNAYSAGISTRDTYMFPCEFILIWLSNVFCMIVLLNDVFCCRSYLLQERFHSNE